MIGRIKLFVARSGNLIEGKLLGIQFGENWLLPINAIARGMSFGNVPKFRHIRVIELNGIDTVSLAQHSPLLQLSFLRKLLLSSLEDLRPGATDVLAERDCPPGTSSVTKLCLTGMFVYSEAIAAFIQSCTALEYLSMIVWMAHHSKIREDWIGPYAPLSSVT
jgi:hypothetical protein